MIILRGSPALSDSRLQKLLADFQAQNLPVTQVSADFIHVVDESECLAEKEQEVLSKLLEYGPKRESREVSGAMFVVSPRPGTISPWSSKATDIAHICGLSKIRRIERAIAYHVHFDSAVTPEFESFVCSKIHDRMTQKVFRSEEELEVLFHK